MQQFLWAASDDILNMNRGGVGLGDIVATTDLIILIRLGGQKLLATGGTLIATWGFAMAASISLLE